MGVRGALTTSGIFETIGGRRYVLALLCWASTFVLALMGKLDANAYVMATVGIAGVYVGGNTAQKIKAQS